MFVLKVMVDISFKEASINEYIIYTMYVHVCCKLMVAKVYMSDMMASPSLLSVQTVVAGVK